MTGIQIIINTQATVLEEVGVPVIQHVNIGDNLRCGSAVASTGKVVDAGGNIIVRVPHELGKKIRLQVNQSGAIVAKPLVCLDQLAFDTRISHPLEVTAQATDYGVGV